MRATKENTHCWSLNSTCVHICVHLHEHICICIYMYNTYTYTHKKSQIFPQELMLLTLHWDFAKSMDFFCVVHFILWWECSAISLFSREDRKEQSAWLYWANKINMYVLLNSQGKNLWHSRMNLYILYKLWGAFWNLIKEVLLLHSSSSLIHFLSSNQEER